jgi:cobalt-zinc-cadmium efflux system protein
MHMVASASGRMQQVLKLSLAATFCYVVATFYFGLRAHSLALVSEAGHNVSDMLAIVLSFVAVYFQARPATGEKTFGYQRAGVLAAFVNALALIVLSAWIALAALHRFATPQPIQPHLMMSVAAAGVLMNGCIAALLWRFSGDVNIRSVFLHMLGDTLSTAAVIAGGAGILFTGMMWIDPVLSILIAGMILYSSIGIVRETLHILLEGCPHGILIEEVRSAMQAVDGVLNVHDLHVWSLGSSSHALASHVTICEMPVSDSAAILERLNQTLVDRFHIHHTTLQFEITDCATTHGCAAPPPLEAVGAHGQHHHHHGHHHHGHSH